VFSPVPGTYSTAQSVSITSSNATLIYYTTDGSTPTTASTLYTGPVSIATTTTLRAIGVDAASSSAVTSGTYTILSPSAPVFTPAAGTYATAQSVSITSANATSIHYTIDGSTPTTTSTLYTGPVSILTTTTLRAIGVDAAGSSPVTSGTYTILPPPSAPVFAPAAGTYSTAQSVSITSAGAASIYYTTNGTTPTTASTLYTGPISIAATTTLRAIGVNAAGSSPITSGTYTIKTAPPIITHGPQSQTVNEGANVSFTVCVTSALPVTYQWYFNGKAIPGATCSNLTLHDVTTANAGAYTVVVTNSSGSTTSAVAQLTVQRCTDDRHDSDSNDDHHDSHSGDDHHDSQENDDR
jgi:hypothetical protein